MPDRSTAQLAAQQPVGHPYLGCTDSDWRKRVARPEFTMASDETMLPRINRRATTNSRPLMYVVPTASSVSRPSGSPGITRLDRSFGVLQPTDARPSLPAAWPW